MAKAAVALKPMSLNLSGIRPLEYKVLVRPVEDKGYYETKSGFKLLKTDTEKERDDHASMEGELVDMSVLAFSYEADAPKPALGATVVFARYSGINITGKDGLAYRLMNDKDVVAVRA